uniref:Uncharacterized protein n=1 Tax=Anguilla anguilla TaxID=7936 RepID=A0A0E9VYX9_ANGAN
MCIKSTGIPLIGFNPLFPHTQWQRCGMEVLCR